eukprot:scaffold5234_cov131-Cylindrotheca_fusiformis.AAC.4
MVTNDGLVRNEASRKEGLLLSTRKEEGLFSTRNNLFLSCTCCVTIIGILAVAGYVLVYHKNDECKTTVPPLNSKGDIRSPCYSKGLCKEAVLDYVYSNWICTGGACTCGLYYIDWDSNTVEERSASVIRDLDCDNLQGSMDELYTLAQKGMCFGSMCFCGDYITLVNGINGVYIIDDREGRRLADYGYEASYISE